MPPLILDIVVDDQDQVVPQHVPQTVGQDIPVGSSTLRPAESMPSLHVMAAQAAAQLQRLTEPEVFRVDLQRAMSSFQPLIESRWKKEQEQLQRLETSFRAMERDAQALINSDPPPWVAAMRTADAHVQAFMHPLKEENERLQRLAAPFQAINARLQQEALQIKEAQALINPPPPPWLTATVQALGVRTKIAEALGFGTEAIHVKAAYEQLRGIFPTAEETARLQQMLGLALRSTATIMPEWTQDPRRYQADLERRMCADALEAFAQEPERANRFVQVLGFRPSPSSLCAVWEALRAGRWMGADKPLTYVRRVARRIYKRDAKQNGSMFNPTLLSLDAGPTGQLLPPTLHASCDPWPDHETRHDAEQRLEQQGLSAGLSPDALTVYKLREIHGQHISRRTLPDMLQWTPKRVARAWREICRKIGPRKK